MRFTSQPGKGYAYVTEEASDTNTDSTSVNDKEGSSSRVSCFSSDRLYALKTEEEKEDETVLKALERNDVDHIQRHIVRNPLRHVNPMIHLEREVHATHKDKKPIHIAAANGSLEMVQLLFKHRAVIAAPLLPPFILYVEQFPLIPTSLWS